MACSICGKEGHNKQSCPNKVLNENARDRASIYRFDSMTESEQLRMGNAIRKMKKTIAPDARATAVESSNRDLPFHSSLSLEGTTDEEEK